MKDVMPNIPRILTALAEWGSCLLYICKYQRRLRGWRLAAVLTLSLVVQCLFLHFTGHLPVALWIPCMAVAVGLMFLTILVLMVVMNLLQGKDAERKQRKRGARA